MRSDPAAVDYGGIWQVGRVSVALVRRVLAGPERWLGNWCGSLRQVRFGIGRIGLAMLRQARDVSGFWAR